MELTRTFLAKLRVYLDCDRQRYIMAGDDENITDELDAEEYKEIKRLLK